MITGPSSEVRQPVTWDAHAAAMTLLVVIWYRVRHGARRGGCSCWICAA
jgi:hypothetical protein